jgi:hypothetical protein
MPAVKPELPVQPPVPIDEVVFAAIEETLEKATPPDPFEGYARKVPEAAQLGATLITTGKSISFPHALVEAYADKLATVAPIIPAVQR